MMADKTIETIERLEELAAWHRAIAERAGSAWVWEARLLAAEELERRALDLRAQQHRNAAIRLRSRRVVTPTCDSKTRGRSCVVTK